MILDLKHQKKIRIAFIKFGGLAAGGTEKFLQTVAANLPKDRFDVDYYFCNAAPYMGSDWAHPDTNPARLTYMLQHEVNLIQFNVGAKNVHTRTHDWVNTNFWELFDERRYDIIQTGRAGHREYPFHKIKNTPIVDSIHLSNHVDNQPNIARVMHLCHWSANRWIERGGDPDRVVIVSHPMDIRPSGRANLRSQLGLEGSFVFGFHQRADDELFSEIPLRAYAEMESANTAFVLLGGGPRYRTQAESLGLQNVRFLPYTGDAEVIYAFLKTLDVYAHGRKDGEVNSTAMAEAMFFGLPIVSHLSYMNNGHVECIGAAGRVCDSVSSYAFELATLQSDANYVNRLSLAATNRFAEKYELSSQIRHITSIYEDVIRNPLGGRSHRFVDQISDKIVINARAVTARARRSRAVIKVSNEIIMEYAGQFKTSGVSSPVETFAMNIAYPPVPSISGRVSNLFHIIDRFEIGGGLRVVDNLVNIGQEFAERSEIICLSGPRPPQSEGRSIRVLNDTADFNEILNSTSSAVVIFHRSGESTPQSEELFRILKGNKPLAVIERNIFGHADLTADSQVVDSIICNSRHTLWRHWVNVGRPDPRIYLTRHHTIYNAVLPLGTLANRSEARRGQRQALGIPNDAFVIGDLCRPDPRKLDGMMLAVLPRLAAEIPNCHFIARQYPEAAAATLKKRLGNKFHNLPMVNNTGLLFDTYAAIDVFAHFASIGESFGMAIAEAMRCGVPVVTGENPDKGNAQAELVVHGRTGFIANSPYSVYRRLKQLAGNPALCTQMGETSRLRFEIPPFSFQSIARQWRLAIEAILGRKGTSSFESVDIERSRRDAVLANHLENYLPRLSVIPSPPPALEMGWVARTEAERMVWRIRKRIKSTRSRQV